LQGIINRFIFELNDVFWGLDLKSCYCLLRRSFDLRICGIYRCKTDNDAVMRMNRYFSYTVDSFLILS
jgi:hypothetical protein